MILTPTGNASIIIKRRDANNLENNGLSENESVAIILPPESFVCDDCKQSYKTKRGLNIDRNRHVKEANVTTANQLNERLKISTPKPSIQKKAKETTDEKAALDSDCKQWQKVFHNFENNEALDLARFDENVGKFPEFLFKANEQLAVP